MAPTPRKELLVLLADMLEADGFFDRILAQCSTPSLSLLELLIARGGTSGDIEAIRDAFSKQSGGPEYQKPRAPSPAWVWPTRSKEPAATTSSCRREW